LEAKKDRGTGFSVFCLRGKWGENQKKGKTGVGEEEEGNTCRQTLDFENLRSPAKGARDWLGYSNIIDMCRSKVF